MVRQIGRRHRAELEHLKAVQPLGAQDFAEVEAKGIWRSTVDHQQDRLGRTGTSDPTQTNKAPHGQHQQRTDRQQLRAMSFHSHHPRFTV